MGSAKTCAGEHGDRHFGHHRHVDSNAVALGNTERLQCVGSLLHLTQQVAVGDSATVARLADPVEGDLLATTGGNVPIDAVLRNVELAIIKPLREGEVPLQGFGEGRAPGQQLSSLFSPEGDRISSGTIVEIGAGIRRCRRSSVRWE